MPTQKRIPHPTTLPTSSIHQPPSHATRPALKLQISEKFRKVKMAWHDVPRHHGTEEIPPPPPKKSCLDRMQDSLACTTAQIRTRHWRSAVYLKRIRKMADDKCWFCRRPAKMTRSHVLLHCPNEKLRAARMEAWEGKDPGGARVLLANPRWERRFVKFLELSGLGHAEPILSLLNSLPHSIKLRL
jgi:hypothetical protein